MCIGLTADTVKCQPKLLTDSFASHRNGGLFEHDDVLDITLSGNTRELINDRSTNNKTHPVLLQYFNEDSTQISIRTRMKTRGHFRKLAENCNYPPLSVSFIKSDSLETSIFNQQRKLKLVMPCEGDKYIIREWLVYKIYNLVTPVSFRARLVRITMKDSKNKKNTEPFLGMMVEEEQQMAKRNGSLRVTRKLKPEQTNKRAFLNMAVFEYLIGNTDWSIQYLQNIKLVAKDSSDVATAVPYDFDHSGIVSAPYAKPAEMLLLFSVQERRYRGYCIRDMNDFNETIELFNSLKNDLYNLYNNCELIDEKYRKNTINYLNKFYEIINDPQALAKEFGYPCDKNGTGNVVIRGIRRK